MNPFDENAPCPKCGSDQITAERLHDDEAEVPEFINRTCNRCGYEWEELPLDA